MPEVHAQQVGIAFQSVAASSADLLQVFRDHQRSVPKLTVGTCSWLSCSASRGPTDCLLSKCICRDGFGTLDGETCVRVRPNQTWTWPRDTGGTCEYLECDASRGPTVCEDGK